MRRPKSLIWLLLLLTAANGLVYLFRSYFQYRPYASREELYRPCDADCRQTWQQYAADFEEELPATRRLSDSLTRGATTPGEKLDRLARHLKAGFAAQEGRPDDQLLFSTPLYQYRRLKAEPGLQLWCGNYAEMLAYLCWAEDIPARVVAIMKGGDQHVVNEVYLEEKGKWILVDLTSGFFRVSDTSGTPLDLQAFRDEVRAGKRVTVTRLNGPGTLPPDTAFVRLYYRPDFDHIYYHRVHINTYSWPNRVVEYLWPRSWYDIYPAQPGSNLPFWIKEVLLLAWLVLFFVFCIRQTKFKL